MNISQLLEALKDPTVNISVGEKLLAGISVAALSMAVVFIVLVLISIIISLLQRDKSTKQENITQTEKSTTTEEIIDNNQIDMNELVSVITASIAAATGNSSNNIVVRKIVRSNNLQIDWQKLAKNSIGNLK